MDTMTIYQAFETMVWFIKQFQDRGPFEDTGSLLHVLNQVGVANDDNETRALWEEWCISVQKVLLPDTLENQLLVHNLITHNENFLGIGPFGEECYARLLSDGRQLWAEVYHGKLTCAGIRLTPVTFESGTGLSTPQHP